MCNKDALFVCIYSVKSWMSHNEDAKLVEWSCHGCWGQREEECGEFTQLGRTKRRHWPEQTLCSVVQSANNPDCVCTHKSHTASISHSLHTLLPRHTCPPLHRPPIHEHKTSSAAMKKSKTGSSHRVNKTRLVHSGGIAKSHSEARGVRRAVQRTLGRKTLQDDHSAIDQHIVNMLEGKIKNLPIHQC